MSKRITGELTESPLIRTAGRRACDAHRRELERLIKRFLEYAAARPLHHFSDGARALITEARPIIEQLDLLCAEDKPVGR